jgi:twinkle protein
VGQCYHCATAFVKYDPLRNKHTEKQYVVPVWKNRTNLSDKAVKWFGGRMISQATLREMRVYTDQEFMPQHGKEVEVICMPYFRNGDLVNIKFRGPGKSFKMVSNAELVFYNLDAIPGAKELIIVEGEIDALSYIEAGYKNVISVPNGAGSREVSYLDNCIDALARVETFYIATDQDHAGIQLRHEIIRRLEPERCKIVDFQGAKDANELLCSKGGLALRSSIENAIEIPINGHFNLRSKYDEIRLLFENGLERGAGIGVPDIDHGLTWRPGQLAVWTGLTSHGKSEAVNFFATRMNIANGWKCAFFSPENMPYQRHLYPKLASLIVGKAFRHDDMSDREFEEVFDYIDDNFKFIDADDDYTVETVINAACMMVKRYGIKVLVIDPYNCFEHRRNKSESETEYIGRFLDSLTRFAKRYNVIIHLVAHPPKLAKLNGKREKPDLYDINGSANFANKADIGITIYRKLELDGSTTGTELIKRKIRFKEQGYLGEVVMKYNTRNGRYDVADDRNVLIPDVSNWLHPNTAVATNAEAYTPATSGFAAYDNDDETPF